MLYPQCNPTGKGTTESLRASVPFSRCVPILEVPETSVSLGFPLKVVSMSRYRGPRLRIVRRLGELPGLTQKTPKSQAPPGQHGATAKKPTQYGVRLMEKQKLRYNYGVTEHQLVNYVKKARCAACSSRGQAALWSMGPLTYALNMPQNASNHQPAPWPHLCCSCMSRLRR